MASTEKLRAKLLDKLAELFQLDQPDLDFGFYRIMKAKADQVRSFIDKDLLRIIEDSFGKVDEERKTELEFAYKEALRTAKEFGAPNPEETEGVKRARAALDAVKEGPMAEADVYAHLYRFFERYYDGGDFISRRYYSRESAGKAAPFAIPYNGEEVKLHWANSDQYYIKTAEYFSNYSFDLSMAAEFSQMSAEERVLNQIPESPLRVHFRIVDASEGEHGNVKAADDKKRFFVLHNERAVEQNDEGELVVNFEYRPLPGGKNLVDGETENMLKDIYGNSLNKGSMPNLAMTLKILENLKSLKADPAYHNLLSTAAPTEKIPNRPLLAKYLNRYTARNSYDYFIHKDLGGFLKRELDFYLKNEVMHLDDIENADVPTVESYLDKLKVIRKIAGKVIEFLAQLENFQKKLWLKKKFVVETNYCITLDRVPEALYPEIAVNEGQREEWVKLFAIDEIESGYSTPLTIEFLKANDKLVLDTALFSADFKARLLEGIEDFDEQCDGVLIHSENFQALNLLQERYREQVKCVYIDPPYNTGGDGFVYKDNYQHSSWISMFSNRLEILQSLISNDSTFFSSIDDNEIQNMKLLLDYYLGVENFESQIIIQSNKRGQTYQSIAKTHEYLLTYLPGINAELQELEKKIPSNSLKDSTGPYELWELRNRNPKFGKHNRPNLYYPIYVEANSYNDENYAKVSLKKTDKFNFEVFPQNSSNEDSCWRWGKPKLLEALSKSDYSIVVAKQKKDGKWNIYEKARKGTTKAKSIWTETEVINEQGTVEVGSLGFSNFGFPKPTGLLKKTLKIGINKNGLILDYFAGSGTTGHAVINLNREDDGARKYILVEMGNYFDTVLKPRITKVVYSSDWKSGKPTTRNTGISHCFKYLRLESYEDTLNNLGFNENKTRDHLMAKGENSALRMDYTLHYLLDVETEGSQSLLNIDNFASPDSYRLMVKKPGSDEQVERTVDLVESFNYLIGLRLVHMATPQHFTATFTRPSDPELPGDQETKLSLEGKLEPSSNGLWWFRKVEGWTPADPQSPNNGQKERVLIVWRNLTGNLEEDNLMLDEWFKRYRLNSRDFEYDTIYVNGSNNLPNLKQDGERWKVRLIEEEFHKKMWEVE